MKEITFSIQAQKKFNQTEKDHEIEFLLEFDETTGDCNDGQSFNPTKGWTNYTQFRQGWTEQDPDLNELLGAIEEYSRSPDLSEIIYNTGKEDIGTQYHTIYMCEDFVENKSPYKYTVTIRNIETR